MVQSNGIHAFLWRDNRVVTILSTSAQPHELGMVQRREHNGTRVNVQCPAALAHYQAFMGGVDKNDQLRQYYHVGLKCRKFYKYIFWFTFEAAIVNSYILHTHYSSRARQPLKEFQLQLAKGLVGEYHSKKRHNRHHAPPTHLSILHFPAKVVRNESTGAVIRSRCWFCYNKRIPQTRRDTPWYCHECKLYLCHTGVPESDCFLQFHRK